MGWGSSKRRGGGRKVRALPQKFLFLGFRRRNLGSPEIFAGMSQTPGGVQKVCAKKACAHLSFPKILYAKFFMCFICALVWLPT